MSENMTKEQFSSDKLDTLAKAQEKALVAAEIVQKNFGGSRIFWRDSMTILIVDKDRKTIATIHVESVQ